LKTPLITDIQKYSIHDGPGIRTTVFFKGCPLHCLWCHNPETQSYNRQLYYYRERCTGCGQCSIDCDNNAIQSINNTIMTDMQLCSGCKLCMEACIHGARELVGRYLEPHDLISELKRDTVFYEESGGGITFSGGEAMTVDSNYLLQVMKPLHSQGYSLGIDTCGHAQYERFQAVLPYTHFFLYDIKLINSPKHEYYTGVTNKLILDNLKRLSSTGANIYLRIPVITQVNANIHDIKEIIQFLVNHKINIIQINLLPYHPMGKNKYETLNMDYKGQNFTAPTREELIEFSQLFEGSGYRTVIGG